MRAKNAYIDAHCHLHFKELEGLDLSEYWGEVSAVSVNGTRPDDWQAVAQLYEAYPEKVIPSFGVHPWKVNDLDGNWLDDLESYLVKCPKAGIGEIGLDKWVKEYDLEKQKDAFLSQMRLAEGLERTMSIHCLKAWGTLKELLTEYKGGRFLLHAYAGPREYLDFFLQKGAYFSFSPYFFYERKRGVRDVFKSIPLDRILVETDAPSMLGPEETWSSSQKPFNKTHQDPRNLFRVYAEFARFLGLPEGELCKTLSENFRKLMQ